MLRIIVKTDDAAHVVNGGADHSLASFKTFDVDLPEVEKHLRDMTTYESRQVVGVELIPPLYPR